MNEKPPLRNLPGDVACVAAFALAVLVGASVVMSWIAPNPEPSLLPALVVGLARFLGELPLLLLCATGAWLGMRCFLGQRPEGIGRWITTAVLAAGGLAFLLAGAWPPHGGRLGTTAVGLFGGLLAAFVGLVLIVVPIWHLWLRPRGAVEAAFSDEVAPDADHAPDAGAGGLSAAEADALLPKPARAWPRPASPYPVDVRLEGRIPEGAQPIQSEAHAYSPAAAPRARQPADPAPGTLSGWAAPAWQAAEQSPREDLAALPRDEPAGPPGAGAAAQAAADEAELAAWRLPRAELLEADGADEDEPEVDPGEGPGEGLGEELAEEPIEAEPTHAESADEAIPAASWEQPGLFSEEEPVDAYGTPITLVETLRKAAPEPGIGTAQHDEEEPEDASEELFADEAEDDAEEELEVELLPHRASAEEPVSEPEEPTEEPPRAAPGRVPAQDELVFQAGVLILDRGRVAVSLLQREFKLDFDEATALLDRLQEAGLIGPYVGGQRRDILLTPEEWSEKQVGAS